MGLTEYPEKSCSRGCTPEKSLDVPMELLHYCNGEVPRDDIGFLTQIIEELKSRFNVDSKRLYIAGFSNGGQMSSRCAVEMGDV